MKKRLEAELISIAHRVLKLKNKSEVDQLFAETQKLYEALSVLKFYGDYIEQQPHPEVNQEELEEKLADSLEGQPAPKLDVEVQQQVAKGKKETVPVDEETEAAEEAQPDIPQEEETEEEKVIVGEINVEDEEEPAEMAEEPTAADSDALFEMAAEAGHSETGETAAEEAIQKEASPAETEKEDKKPSKQIAFEDFLGDFKEVEFVKPNDISLPKPQTQNDPEAEPGQTEAEPSIKEPETEPKVKEPKEDPAPQKTAILNEKLATGINIGLNDRVGFVKYLFDGSNEDFNRVLSQLNTFDTFAEADEFINDMVKPDYNNWKGQEEFSERFMDIVKQKFK